MPRDIAAIASSSNSFTMTETDRSLRTQSKSRFALVSSHTSENGRKVQFRRVNSYPTRYPHFGFPSTEEIPDDVALPGEKYKSQRLSHTSQRKFFPIYISEIDSLSDVYIQLKGEDVLVALPKLIEDLNTFYNTNEANSCYIMADHHIVPGAVCVNSWADGIWYRCVILEAPLDSNCVKISYVDYGTISHVQKGRLRYLRRCFLALPAQSIKTRIAFVEPSPYTGNNPDTRILDFFIHNYMEKELMAQVVQNNMYLDCVSLWLCDCTSGNRVYLNKFLVDQGLALFNREEIEQTQFLPCCLTSSFRALYLPGSSRLANSNQIFPNIPNSDPAFGYEIPNLLRSVEELLLRLHCNR